jgi:hypothetical protein
MSRPNRPSGTHDPSQKSLQRWDSEGGAPKSGRPTRDRDPARLAKPAVGINPASALRRHYAELVVAVNKANTVLRASGTTSQKFLEADRSVGKIARRIKQIRDATDKRGTIPRPTSKATARKASQLAAREIEGLADKSQSAAEQQRRKRTLIRGPKEFRDIRDDQPKTKR